MEGRESGTGYEFFSDGALKTEKLQKLGINSN